MTFRSPWRAWRAAAIAIACAPSIAHAQQRTNALAAAVMPPPALRRTAPVSPEVPDESGVIVTGTRTERRLADSPVATEVITRADIEASGAENLATVLEEQPGMDVSRSGVSGASLRLQGLDPQYVLILVNGERVAGRINGAIDLTRFPVDDLERIEIVRGPSSALYGADALGGVVNMITRRPHRPWEGELHARYGGPLNDVDASGRAGMVRGPVAVSLTGGFHRRDAYDLNPADAATNGSTFSSFNATGRVEWRPDPRWIVATGAEYFQRDQQGVDSGAGGAVFDRRNLTETTSIPLVARYRYGGGDGDGAESSQLRVGAWYTLFRDQFRYDQRGSNALDQYQQTRNHLGQLSGQLDQVLPGGHVLTVGGETYHERLEADRLRGGVGHRARYAVFVQDQWTILPRPRLVVVPGFRLDVDTQFGIAPTPKLQVRFDPAPTLAVRASYGWGFRAPSFQELLLVFENASAGYVVEGNTQLRPETSRAVNAGVEWRPGRWLWLSANFFRNDIENLINTVAQPTSSAGETTRYRYQNVSAAWTMGTELSARLRPATGLVLDLSYTLTASHDLENDRPLEGRALHRGTASVQYRHAGSGLEAMARAAFVGPRPFYAAEGNSEAPPYVSLDLRAAWNYRRLLTLFVGCDNVLGVGDPQFLPVPPRTLYAGATTRF